MVEPYSFVHFKIFFCRCDGTETVVSVWSVQTEYTQIHRIVLTSTESGISYAFIKNFYFDSDKNWYKTLRTL